MKTAYVLLADGFEEIEALTSVDVFRRAGIDVKTVGITGNGKTATGAHKIVVECDIACGDMTTVPSLLILPGGMPGAENIDKFPKLDGLIDDTLCSGGYVGAICAAPFILGKRGYLNGKEATCFPGFEKFLNGAVLTEGNTVRDGNIITSRCMGTALDFALECTECLVGRNERIALEKAIKAENSHQ